MQELSTEKLEATQPTVVVVENNAASRQIFEQSSKQLGFEFIAFTSAEDSLDYLQENTPDLLFLNILMPDKDGLTFLRDLRNFETQANTPVVMITSKDYAQDRSVAKELGAVEFITKPVLIQQITDVVTQHTSALQSKSE